MSEVSDLCAAVEAAPPAKGAPVLATLVKVAGSAYSGPGARLLMFPDGAMAGALGAVCFEQDLAARAERLRASGAREVATYDLRKDDARPWGLGMGCHGKLDLLLEPVAPGHAPSHLAFLRDAARDRQAAVVATLFRGGDGDQVGARLLLRADGAAAGDLAEGPFGSAVRARARAALKARRTRLVTFAAPTGRVEVLLEYVPPPIALVVCGGGRDTGPLARIGAELGWQVTVIARDEVPAHLDERMAALVMTHNYERDLLLLRTFLTSPAPYVGLLGARDRARRLVHDLASRRDRPRVTARQLSRLHAPVGLDIGSETPAEVALAIVAEVQATFAGRRGGPLTTRKGRIHDRP